MALHSDDVNAQTVSNRMCRAAILVLGLITAVGCQSWGPADGLGLGSFGKEANIKKLAAQDSFPSPEEVGLSSN